MSDFYKELYESERTSLAEFREQARSQQKAAIKTGFWAGWAWAAFSIFSAVVVSALVALIVLSTMNSTDAAMECARQGAVAVETTGGSFWSLVEYVCVKP